MADDRNRPPGGGKEGQKGGGFLGSLKEALAAASRDEASAATAPKPDPAKTMALPAPGGEPAASDAKAKPDAGGVSAHEAARETKATTTLAAARDRHVEADAPPTTRVYRGAVKGDDAEQRTQLVRGKQDIKRGQFHQDPVVGWLVVVGGKGLGSFRPVFEGNNTVGRSASQRVALDFGDDSISSEEQAYIRYDSTERAFLFVPNLAKTNVVSINNKRPTNAVELKAMDVITMGRTQLVFVPFCGPEFDWGELSDVKGRSL